MEKLVPNKFSSPISPISNRRPEGNSLTVPCHCVIFLFQRPALSGSIKDPRFISSTDPSARQIRQKLLLHPTAWGGGRLIPPPGGEEGREDNGVKGGDDRKCAHSTFLYSAPTISSFWLSSPSLFLYKGESRTQGDRERETDREGK